MVVTIDVDPVAIHLGPFAVAWYGLAVGLGIAGGIWLTLREARRKGVDPDAVAGLIWWVLLGGIVGARLLHVIDRWDLYASDPPRALAGGFAAWRKGLPLGRLFDAAAPGIVLGQAIGRIGCLVTGDALGPATNWLWGLQEAQLLALGAMAVAVVWYIASARPVSVGR